MTDREIQLVTGALLHDIGKVIFRSGEHRKHSASGYEYLKEDRKIQDPEILDCVRYHHGDELDCGDFLQEKGAITIATCQKDNYGMHACTTVRRMRST